MAHHHRRTPHTPTHRIGTTQTATGHLNNTPIHLTAHHVPHLLDQATTTADDPYYHHGRIYDLARGHTDRHGQTWLYTGQRQPDNTPSSPSTAPTTPLPPHHHHHHQRPPHPHPQPHLTPTTPNTNNTPHSVANHPQNHDPYISSHSHSTNNTHHKISPTPQTTSGSSDR
ncbi:BN159_2729 family protein [Streptomyces chiangmaiensis]